MQVTFDTASIGPEEVRGLIALLTTLSSASSAQSSLASTSGSLSGGIQAGLAAEITYFQKAQLQGLQQVQSEIGEQYAQDVAQSQSGTQPETSDSPAPARRGRKPKVTEITSAASVAPSDTAPSTETSPTTESKPNGKAVTADELRGLLNGYISRHTMDEAIAKLRAFGCQRVTEALALPPDQLSALAGELNA